MIQKLIKSLRKFVCSKLKTYKRNRYRAIQPPPSPSPNLNSIANYIELKPDAPVTPLAPKAPDTCNASSTKKSKRHTNKVIREQNICFKSGEYTRNPFFNYLREYRKTHCGMTIVEQAVEAGAEWRCMTQEEKSKFVVFTDGKPHRRRRYKRRSIYWIKRSKIEL